jgi:hypothetical protein
LLQDEVFPTRWNLDEDLALSPEVPVPPRQPEPQPEPPAVSQVDLVLNAVSKFGVQIHIYQPKDLVSMGPAYTAVAMELSELSAKEY